MAYAAVPQMHRTGKKSPAEAGPRAFGEGGSLDFRSGTIPSAGAGSKRKAPVLKLGALRWIPMRQLSLRPHPTVSQLGSRDVGKSRPVALLSDGSGRILPTVASTRKSRLGFQKEKPRRAAGLSSDGGGSGTCKKPRANTSELGRRHEKRAAESPARAM